MARHLMESFVAMTSGPTPRSEFFKLVNGFRYHKGRADLSFRAHPLGLYREAIVEQAIRSGIQYFQMRLLNKDVSPVGLQAKYAYQIRHYNDWVRIFRELNAVRKTKNPFPGLGLHHNSTDIYVPVPSANLRGWQKEARKERSKFIKGLK